MPEQLTHPTHAELQAFSLGQLPPQASAAIETHITECPSCCNTLLGISDEDTFVALLKEAEEASDDATIAQHLTASSESGDAAADIPESLFDHARYRVVGLVGKGGMGAVFKAEHRLMERTVALKVINRDLFSKPEAVQRFHREVRAAARLSHPNIVTAYDAEQAGDVHFLAMEFVDGTVLSEIVKQRGPLPVREALEYIRQAAAGLEHAHEMGMVHRDIKPQNLMLDGSGNIKILDFGLANFASESAADAVSGDTSESAGQGEVLQHLTQLGAMMGTPDYIAPEQARDARSADIRSDIYSLGCTLYFLLTGRPPFAEDSVLEKVRAHLEREPESLRAVRGEVPAELDDVVRRMMAKDPAERYQTPAEVAEALGLLTAESDDSTAPSLVPQGLEGRSGRRPKWVVAAGLLLPLFAAAGVILYLATDTGKLEINVDEDVPGARIVLTKGAKEYATFDVKQGSEVKSIWTGDYTISLQGAPGEVDMSVRTKRGDSNEWGPPDNYKRDPVVVYRGGDIRIEISKSRSSVLPEQRSTGTVRISGGGGEMRVLEEGDNRIILRSSGEDENDISVPGASDAVSISPNRAQISRGGKEFVTITRNVTSADVAQPGTRRALVAFIQAARPELSDEELKRVLAEYSDALAEVDIDGSRALVALLAGLPENARQALFREGYLKWEFGSLDPQRQAAMKTFVGQLLSQSTPDGIPESGVESLDRSDVGFAVISMPDSNSQAVVWYAQWQPAPIPIMLPLLGVNSENRREFFQTVWTELVTLEKKSYSKLSLMESPETEPRREEQPRESPESALPRR